MTGAPDVLPEDLNVELALPVISKPNNRTPAALLAIGEYLAPQARYLRRDVTGDGIDETFCNFLVREACRMLGLFLPRLRANDLVDHLTEPTGADAGWSNVTTRWVVRDLAEAGRPVIVGWKNPNPARPGHVALVMPPRNDAERDSLAVFIAQAGRVNFAHETLATGFGVLPVSFFAHL